MVRVRGSVLWCTVVILAMPTAPPRAGADPADDRAARFCKARARGRDGPAPRPNLIVVMTDDQRWDSLPQMPVTLERLAGDGLAFHNGFVTTPLCGPSRASFLTGQLMSRHGVATNDLAPFDPGSTIATWLQEAGYATGIVGKYLNAYWRLSPGIPPGWDRWQVITRPTYYGYELIDQGVPVAHGHDPGHYSTDVLGELAVEFIEDHAGGPFFLYLSTWAPHDPARAAPRHEGAYADLPPLRAPGYHEADITDKAVHIHWARYLRGLAPQAFVDDMDREYQAMRESLLAVDDAVEAILDTLARLGLERDTVVVFTSDNGLLRGEHWLYWKVAPYEESVRVPLVVHYPPLTEGGRESDELVVNVDLAPTLAELAGARVPKETQGRSLVPLLCGQESRWRRAIVLENDIPRDFLGMPAYRVLRTHRWKYVRYAGDEPFEELYRIDRDPAELDNLARTAPDARRTAATLARMRSRLGRLIED